MTTTTERGFAQRMEATLQELEAVREKLRSVSSQLAEAETALRFYGDPRNYEARRILEGKIVFQDLLKNDFTLADNEPNTKLAGMRAREYFNRYAND